MTAQPADAHPVDPERAAVADYAADMRRALDAVAAARPPVSVWRRAAALARALEAMMRPHPWVGEEQRIVGRVREVPGRAQNLVPPLRRSRSMASEVEAEVVLDHTHLGTGSAHGGVAPLMFDELLGTLANVGATRHARTAYLHVDYRAAMPIGVPVRLRAWVVEVAGRKRLLRGSAEVDGTVVVQVEALFVEART